MKRSMKKAVAFGLALSMLAGCIVVSAEETKDNGIAVIEEAVYDEAVSFSDGIVLIENGHWDEMTVDTNIVFYDAVGNKKVISNKGKDGEKLYDTVNPFLTDVKGVEYIEAVKDGLKVFYSPVGELIGEEGQFYKDIKVLADEALISKDGVYYILAGVENAKGINAENLFNWSVGGDLLKIQTNSKIVVAKADGTIIKEFPVQDTIESTASLYKNGAFLVNADGKAALYNPEYEEVISYDGRLRVLGRYNDDELLLIDGWDDGTLKLINSQTGEKVFECANTMYPESGDDWFVAEDSEGNIFIYYLNGDVINFNAYIQKAAAAEGFIDYEHEVTCEDGYLIITVKGYNNGYHTVNYIYSIENIAIDTNGIRVENKIKKIYPEKNTIITSCKDKDYIGDIYSLDGKLIKNLYSETGIEYGINPSVEKNWPGLLDVLYFRDENSKYIYSILNVKGSLTGLYKSAFNSGEILVGDSGNGNLEVINYYGEIVHNESGEIQFPGTINSEKVEKIFGLNYNHYFGISYKDGSCKLFDYSGNELDGLAGYSGIGPSLKITVGDRKYEYTDLKGGLCVTRKTDADGNYKYGVIKLPVSETEIEPTTPPTATPVPTPEPDYATGDINGDGVINAQDALYVLKYAAKLDTLSEKQFVAADVDTSKNVNATDALYILKYAAKLIVRFVFDPEENVRILEEYIKENGTINENGNKQILMDYVALGDSWGTVEYDSFEYDSDNDWIIYTYERVADYPEDCLKFTITMKNVKRTHVKVEWKDIVGNEVFDLECESSFYNKNLTLDSNFEADLTSGYLSGINDFTGKKQSIWQAEMKELYNSYVHSALISMEDYFSKTVIMNLPDIYESYKYNAQKQEDLLYPGSRSDKTIKNNLNSLSTRLDENGIKVDGFAYFEELIEYETSDGAAYAYAYVEKNTETNDVYFYLDAYHIESDMAVFVYVQPYANRNSFVDVILYEANGDQYEATKEVQSMISSMDFDFDGEYEYQCVYPENGDIKAEEKSIIDQDVNVLIEILDEVLGENAGLSAYSFGFINY